MILTDVDGVLLDWFAGFKQYLVESGIKVAEGEPSDWSMVGWVDHPDISALIAKFNASPDFGRLVAYPEAVNNLQYLHTKHGHEIVAITSCSDAIETFDRRTRNLLDTFGPIFREVFCLPLMMSKTEVLKNYPRGTVWVEDSLHGAKAGYEAGHRVFLLNRPYNQHAVDFPVERVDNWDEIYQRINA